jgi:ferredoxin
MKVDVDWELCEGHGICSQEVPEVFELRESDQVTLLNDQPPEELRPQIEAAARFCPKNAITVKG